MKEKVKEIIPYIIVLIIVLLLKQYVFTTIKVNGSSMKPTLHDKDIMIMDKLSYRFKNIERFDIVVIDKEYSKLIKRVIGLPNEVVEYKDNKLYINGEYVEDKYNNPAIEDFTYTLRNNEYFVIGDNRGKGQSLDSRALGSVHKKEIIGKANLTIFPLTRIGIK